jgi:hypothetical protein
MSGFPPARAPRRSPPLFVTRSVFIIGTARLRRGEGERRAGRAGARGGSTCSGGAGPERSVAPERPR